MYIPGCKLLVGSLELRCELMEGFHLSTECSVRVCEKGRRRVRGRERGTEREREGEMKVNKKCRHY